MLSVTRPGYMMWFTIHSHKMLYLHSQKVSVRIGMNAREIGGQNELLKQVLMLKGMLIKLWQDGFLGKEMNAVY